MKMKRIGNFLGICQKYFFHNIFSPLTSSEYVTDIPAIPADILSLSTTQNNDAKKTNIVAHISRRSANHLKDQTVY